MSRLALVPPPSPPPPSQPVAAPRHVEVVLLRVADAWLAGVIDLDVRAGVRRWMSDPVDALIWCARHVPPGAVLSVRSDAVTLSSGVVDWLTGACLASLAEPVPGGGVTEVWISLWVSQIRQQPQLSATPPGPRVIACDGSRGFGRGGWAWVDNRGRHESGRRRGLSINQLEAMAIREALRSVRREQSHPRPTVILSDSLAALRWCRRCLSAEDLARMNVQLRWIRAHSGHPLHDLADQVAVHVRRFGEVPRRLSVSRRARAVRQVDLLSETRLVLPQPEEKALTA